MARVAYDHSADFLERRSQSSSFLTQLSGAHDRLMGEMENLGLMTAGSRPDLAVITAGRWRISQASLYRRNLAAKTFDFLSSHYDGTDLLRLREVRTADQELMRRSVAHVANWSTRTICQNWNGYCEASRNIRLHMKAHLLLEQQSFYPLLERLAARGI